MTYASKLKDPRWQKKRLEILNRDQFSCIKCGDDKSTLHVHHVCYQSNNPWETESKFLQTLCEQCHKNEEEWIIEESESLIKHLKQCGFSSLSFAGLRKCFTTDRGWTDFEPSFDILAMAINDNDIWTNIDGIYWERLSIRMNNDTLTFNEEDNNNG